MLSPREATCGARSGGSAHRASARLASGTGFWGPPGKKWLYVALSVVVVVVVAVAVAVVVVRAELGVGGGS